MLQLLPNLLYKILQIGASTLVDMLFVIKFVRIINIFLDILLTYYVSSPRKKEKGSVNRHCKVSVKKLLYVTLLYFILDFWQIYQ